MKPLTVKRFIKLLEDQVKKGRGDAPVGYSVTGYDPKTKKASDPDLWSLNPKDFLIEVYTNCGIGLSLGNFRVRQALTPAMIRRISGKNSIIHPMMLESTECTLNAALEEFWERYDIEEVKQKAENPDTSSKEMQELMLDVVRSDLRDLLALYNNLEAIFNHEIEYYNSEEK